MKLAVIAFAVALSGAAQAFAQTIPEVRGTPNGLFGNDITPAPSRQEANVSLILSSGFDAAVSGRQAVARQYFDPQSTAHANVVTGTGDYTWQGRTLTFRIAAASVGRHSRDTAEITPLNQSAAASVTSRLPWRSELRFEQQNGFSPSFVYNPFPEGEADQESSGTGGDIAIPTVAPPFRNGNIEAYTSMSHLTLRHDVSRRTNVSIQAERSQSEYRGTEVPQPGIVAYAVTGLVGYRTTRNTRATVQYLARSGNFPYSGGPVTTAIATESGLEIGGSYTPRLSPNRRLMFDAGIGSSLVDAPDASGDPDRRVRSYRVVGQFGAAYSLKAWEGTVRYRQGVEYLYGLTQPAAIRGFTLRLDGTITRRLDLLTSAAYTIGESVMNSTGPTFDTYTSSARLRYAFNRQIAMFGEYLYYYYYFSESSPLVPGIPRRLERNGIRGGVMVLLPVLGR